MFNTNYPLMKKTSFLGFALACMLLSQRSSAQTEVTFYTNMGSFVVKLEDSRAPITSGNFISLVTTNFYDGVIFHRVIDGFMIQGGDPTGTGSGGPGYAIADEFNSALSNVQKTISMANAGRNTGGSQFFINLVNNTYLDFDKPQPLDSSMHPVFGIVTSGFPVVQAIGKVAVNGSKRPLSNVVMDSLRVTKQGPLMTGLAENDFTRVQIYPNPVSSETAISIISNTEKLINVSIFDQTGRTVYNSDQRLSKGMNTIPAEELQKLNMKAGLYFLHISDGVSVAQQKFVQLR